MFRGLSHRYTSRNPHLGKASHFVHAVQASPLSWPYFFGRSTESGSSDFSGGPPCLVVPPTIGRKFPQGVVLSHRPRSPPFLA